jgi:hypothetical protein
MSNASNKEKRDSANKKKSKGRSLSKKAKPGGVL